MAQPGADAKHFLGAVVVQSQDSILGGLPASSVIDGQQRLTTLQLLFDATAATLETAGHDALAAQLDRLTHNETIYVSGAGTRLKLRHSNKDRVGFDEVMDAEAPIDHAALNHGGARVVRAHEYFTAVVTAWLAESPEAADERAQGLTDALTRGVQLVAIKPERDRELARDLRNAERARDAAQLG